MEPVRARQEGTSNAAICLYTGDMASQMRAGVKLEGIQWSHQDNWSLEDVVYGGEVEGAGLVCQEKRRMEGTKEQPTATWRACTERME